MLWKVEQSYSMLMLSNANAMILMTDFEKAGGGEQDQKRFLELLRAEARQLKINGK